MRENRRLLLLLLLLLLVVSILVMRMDVKNPASHVRAEFRDEFQQTRRRRNNNVGEELGENREERLSCFAEKSQTDRKQKR